MSLPYETSSQSSRHLHHLSLPSTLNHQGPPLLTTPSGSQSNQPSPEMFSDLNNIKHLKYHKNRKLTNKPISIPRDRSRNTRCPKETIVIFTPITNHRATPSRCSTFIIPQHRLSQPNQIYHHKNDTIIIVTFDSHLVVVNSNKSRIIT
ncbi:hypothetical protein HanPI659440_Chr06g0225561 [Helianthus annuus]|nr:hypothetical protein HanPI659440_Chr06g0225561 [Helianthus annuus]